MNMEIFVRGCETNGVVVFREDSAFHDSRVIHINIRIGGKDNQTENSVPTLFVNFAYVGKGGGVRRTGLSKAVEPS